MRTIQVNLFGHFELKQGEQTSAGWNNHKSQELLVYLLFNRNRSHLRQVLAGQLWPDYATEVSLKYFRQAIWQMHSALHCEIVAVNAERVSLSNDIDFWVDSIQFEQAFMGLQRVRGEDLDEGRQSALQDALQLYRGNLLEGWGQNWVLFERERFQRMYLELVEKQMAFSEVHGEYKSGLEVGLAGLRQDAAHEGIHQRMIQIYHLLGDRTAALRQYERCVQSLQNELGVTPSASTQALYRRVCNGLPAVPVTGRPAPAPSAESQPAESAPAQPASPPDVAATLSQLTNQLEALQRSVAELAASVQDVISNITQNFNKGDPPPGSK